MEFEIAGLEESLNESCRILDRANERGEGYEDLADSYEAAYDLVAGALEEAIRMLKAKEGGAA